MAENFKTGSKLFLKLTVVSIMCFMVVISVNIISIGMFTDKIGYDVYGVSSASDESVKLYSHYHADGEDTKKAEYEEDGYTLSFIDVRSKPTATQKKFFYIITQGISLILLYAFIYPQFWEMGMKDNNLANFGHIKRDWLRGFKCGAIAIIPAIVFYGGITALKVSGSTLPVVLIKIFTPSFYALSEIIIGSASVIKDLSAAKIAVLAAVHLIIPALAALGYILGQFNFSFAEKVTYKKKEEKVRK